MKVLSAAAAAFLLVESCSGFSTPAAKSAFGVVSARGNVALNMNDKVPFFAEQEAAQAEPTDAELNEMTLEEEVELMTKQEMAQTKKISKLRTANGVDYAPWMNIDADDEEKIRQVMKEKAEARRKREEQERSVSGNLYFDSQAQELSGTGLKGKIIDGDVELEWATRSEKDTRGFVVKRRPAKTSEFEPIASYEEWGPLQSKGEEGGIYRYLDNTVSPGGWVYRVSEVDNSGSEADLCQCLVEVQTEEEQAAAKIAAIGFAAFAVLAVVAGLALDPYAG